MKFFMQMQDVLCEEVKKERRKNEVDQFFEREVG